MARPRIGLPEAAVAVTDRRGRGKPARAKGRRRRGWKFYALLALGIPLLLLSVVTGYYYVTFSRMIDARLHGEFQRADPRVFARPFEVRRGQSLTARQLVERLNDLGYAQRTRAEQPGEFTIGRDTLLVVPRDGEARGRLSRIHFVARGKNQERSGIDFIESVDGGKKSERLELSTPLITALITTGREKRRDVPLAQIHPRMVQAVLAIEDRRFYDHPGVDPIAVAGAFFTYIFGSKSYMRGGSTLTQQLVKNTFLTPERTPKRKFQEWIMSIALERRLTKDQVLELYLNDVWVGQRGSFAIHGVPEAARLFFGKDVANVTLSEAATIAGVIQSPPRHSPFNNPERSKERRNVVLKAMVDSGFIPADAATRAASEPLVVAARSLENEAPYFVDLISQELQDKYKVAGAVDVYTTLDLHLQKLAQDAVREGLTHVDEILAKRKRQRAQAALVAIDPRTGEILALVGGRSHNQSQFNRAINANRQPGSVFKPFVFLAAFESALAQGRSDITPASVVIDEPTTWEFNEQTWTPANYDGQYEGAITLRRALALSRNIVTIKVAESAGYDQVAGLWRRVGAGTPPRPYPSIALGVFEATPLQVASAYTLFANGGTIRTVKPISRIVSGGKEIPVETAVPRSVARPDTTFLVTNMMRSVINEGTGAGARAAGFTPDAAGKSGTTNDLRDAWFVGFTPELLTVVWVGLDDNQPVGLTGTQAALPIWTTFMTRALAGRTSTGFEPPEGIAFAEIDRDTGKLATPGCPRVFREAFIQGTEPVELCYLHTFRP
ncbi:MAG TPA: PBP1A family penicillin-binding protein [Vicinamibacterales bacterium]|nr:PBP1A family penicillin-binding protein [Vicinamibacterales bacterium]